MMKLNVLFANDDVLTQWVMSDVMMGAGYTVVSACRASQVLALLEDAPDFDILLADVTVFDTGTGAGVGEAWRKALPGRPLIYTGASHTRLLHPLRYHESFLKTPFSARGLLRAIDSALEESLCPMVLPALSSGFHHVH